MRQHEVSHYFKSDESVYAHEMYGDSYTNGPQVAPENLKVEL